MIPEPGSFTTPTPRTDDQQWVPDWNGMGPDPTPVVDADFARELERENTAARRALEIYVAKLDGTQQHRDTLRELLEQMLNVAENADETGYVADCGFVDLDKLHEKVRAALAT